MSPTLYIAIATSFIGACSTFKYRNSCTAEYLDVDYKLVAEIIKTSISSIFMALALVSCASNRPLTDKCDWLKKVKEWNNYTLSLS